MNDKYTLPFDVLLGDDTTRHLLDVFSTKQDIAVSFDGLVDFTGDSHADLNASLELLLDIDLIEQSHDGDFYRLNHDNNDVAQHLIEIREQLIEPGNAIREFNPPEDEELYHTRSPFNCLLKTHETRKILGNFLIYETLPLDENSFETFTDFDRDTITTTIDFLVTINLAEPDPDTDAYRLADTELTQNLAQFDLYLYDQSTRIFETLAIDT